MRKSAATRMFWFQAMFLSMCGTGSATPLRLARRGVILAAWSRLRGWRGQFEQRQTRRSHHCLAFALGSAIPRRLFRLAVTATVVIQGFRIMVEELRELLGRDILNCQHKFLAFQWFGKLPRCQIRVRVIGGCAFFPAQSDQESQ